MIDIALKLQLATAEAINERLPRGESDAVGYFVESEDAGRWIDVALRVCGDPMSCDFFPIWKDGGLKGVFIRVNSSIEATCDDGALGYDRAGFTARSAVLHSARGAVQHSAWKLVLLPESMSAVQLWIPVQSQILPTPLASEWPLLILGPLELLVWHPALGLLSIDPSNRLGLESLIAAPKSERLVWNLAVEGTALPERLIRVEAPPPPTLEQWLEQSRDGMGDRSQDLMALPPSEKEKRGRPFESLGAMTRSAAGRAVSWITDRIAGLKQDPSKKQTPRQIVPTQTGMAERSSAASRKALSSPQWLQNIRDWAKRQVEQWNETLEARREASVSRLLEMLEDNPDEGLRYAIPMSDDPGRGLSPPGSDLVARELRWGNAPSGGVDSWSVGLSAQRRLREKYLELARKELSNGRYERAATIYAQLLGDFQQAAQALEKGKFYRQAALIYRERLSSHRKAAEMYCLAGDFDFALDIYHELALYLEAGDLYQRLGQTDLATAEYLKHVDTLCKQSRPCDAADVLVDKLNQPDRAVALLTSRWPNGQQARACAQKTLDLLSKLERHGEANNQIDRLVNFPGIAEAGVWPSEFLSGLAKSYPDASVRENAQRGLFVNASQVIRSSQNASIVTAITASLCKAIPEDRLLQRDSHRFAQETKNTIDAQAKLKKSLLVKFPQRTLGKALEPVQTMLLSKDVEWFGLIPTARGPLCFGERDGALLVQPMFPSKPLKKTSRFGVESEILSFFGVLDTSPWLRYAGSATQTGESFMVIVGEGKAQAEFGEGSSYWLDDRLTFHVTPASTEICDCSYPFDFGPSNPASRVLLNNSNTFFLTKSHGQIRLGIRDMLGRVSYPSFPSKDAFRDFEEMISREMNLQLPNATSAEEYQWIAVHLASLKWRVARHDAQLLISCGTRFNVYDPSTLLQSIEVSSPIESLRVSNRFTRPRVILGLHSGVMMQWLKADDFQSCIIDDTARNSHNCFVRTGHIAIAHDAGIDLYVNQGFKIKLVASHVSDLGYVAIETDQEVFWTLTKDGLVQKWEIR